MAIRATDLIMPPGYVDETPKVMACPNCHGEAVWERMVGGFEYTVHCTACGVWLGEWCEGVEEAIDKWNSFCLQESKNGVE